MLEESHTGTGTGPPNTHRENSIIMHPNTTGLFSSLLQHMHMNTTSLFFFLSTASEAEHLQTAFTYLSEHDCLHVPPRARSTSRTPSGTFAFTYPSGTFAFTYPLGHVCLHVPHQARLPSRTPRARLPSRTPSGTFDFTYPIGHVCLHVPPRARLHSRTPSGTTAFAETGNYKLMQNLSLSVYMRACVYVRVWERECVCCVRA